MPLFDRMPQDSWQNLYQIIESKNQTNASPPNVKTNNNL